MQGLSDVPLQDRDTPLAETLPLAPAPPMVSMPLSLMLGIATRAEEAGRIDEAEPIAASLLKAAPEDSRVLHLGGIVAFRTERRTLAVSLLERAIAREPRNGLYLRNISEMYRVVGRLDDALAAARHAVALQPGDSAALHNQAVIHHERGEIELGLACSRRAVSLRPDMAGAHFAIAEAQLLRGEYAEGWEEYEWRFRMPGVPALLPVALQRGRSQWGGGSLGTGRLLLIGDQGFGDVIQFSRYIPWALAKGQPTILATSVEMAPLMRRMFPDLAIATNWAECTMFAAFCPLSGLPRLHGTRLDTIPPALPIPIDPERAALWRTKLDLAIPAGLRRVGLVWAGRPTHRNDRNRTMALSTLAPPLADGARHRAGQSAEGRCFGRGHRLFRARHAGRCRAGHHGLRGHGGGDRGARPRGDGGHLGGAYRGCDGEAVLGSLALHMRLALAAGEAGHALVSVFAALPAAGTGALGRAAGRARRGARQDHIA